MNKLSYIDFEKRILVGKSGKVYNIQPEKIASKLWAEYQIRGALLGSDMSFENYANGLVKIENYLRNGKENAQGNTANALGVLSEMIQSAGRFQDQQYNAQVEFCSIFCKSENEPVDQNDESLNKRKFEDWSEIPQPFFLALVSASIIMFKQSLESLKESSKREVELD